jgi:uncharacterized protein YjgD (DUF1641 family)
VAEKIEFAVRRDVREELRHKLEQAPVQHAEAVLAFYALLQEAQDHGVLDTLRGAIGAGDEFVGKAAEFANTPEGIRTMRNLLILIKLAGEIDPAILRKTAGAVAASLPDTKSERSAPPSFWQLMKRVSGKESRRTLGMLTAFLQNFGRE